MKHELELDKAAKINSLCTRDETGIKVVCFRRAHVLISFAWKFCVFNELSSSLFHDAWILTRREAKCQNPNLSVSDLEQKVWNPAFNHCQAMLKELQTLSITLSNVDKLFWNYKENELTVQFKLLDQGISKCVHKNPMITWVQKTVDKITEYRRLCDYSDAANSFLELKKLLKLSGGDFKNVQKISGQVIFYLFIIGNLYLFCVCLAFIFYEGSNIG